MAAVTMSTRLMNVVDECMEKEFLPFLSERIDADLATLVATWRQFVLGDAPPAIDDAPKKSKKPSDKKSKKASPASSSGGKTPPVVDAEESIENYSKMTVAQLKELCKSRNLKYGGSKFELVARLQPSEQKLPESKYASMKINELKDICKNLGIPHSGSKDKIIADLNKFDEGVAVVKVQTKKSNSYISDSDSDATESKKKTRPKKSNHAISDSEGDGPYELKFEYDQFKNKVEVRYGLVLNKHDAVVGYKDEEGHICNLTSHYMELCKKLQLRYEIENADDAESNGYSSREGSDDEE